MELIIYTEPKDHNNLNTIQRILDQLEAMVKRGDIREYSLGIVEDYHDIDVTTLASKEEQEETEEETE